MDDCDSFTFINTSESHDGNNERIWTRHRVFSMSVVSLLAHVQMRSHDAVCRVVNAKTCSAKLVGNSVVASGLAH